MSANNIHIFEGRLGQDPEIRQAGNHQVASLNIAVKKIKKDKPLWFRLNFWNQKAEILSKFAKKGSRMLVQCEADINEWTDKNGINRQDIVFNVNDMVFLDQKPAQQNYQQPNDHGNHPSPNQSNNQNDDFLEDSIPF